MLKHQSRAGSFDLIVDSNSAIICVRHLTLPLQPYFQAEVIFGGSNVNRMALNATQLPERFIATPERSSSTIRRSVLSFRYSSEDEE